MLSSTRVGIEPTNGGKTGRAPLCEAPSGPFRQMAPDPLFPNHQGLSLAALPVCVPCQRVTPPSVPGGTRTRDLHRDRVASTPGCSTRTITSGPGRSSTHSIPLKRGWSADCLPGQLPTSAPGAGVEPTLAGSKPAVLPLDDPGIEDHLRKRKERELDPQGLALGRFRDGCHRQLACPSV